MLEGGGENWSCGGETSANRLIKIKHKTRSKILYTSGQAYKKTSRSNPSKFERVRKLSGRGTVL